MTIQNAALAFLLVIGGAWLFSKLGKAGGIAVLLVVALLAGGWFAIHSVQSFTGTALVAQVQASPIQNAPHTMAISLTFYDANGNPQRSELELSGDRWEMNCSVIRYYDWVNWLGLSSAYSCDRITSQYDGDQAHTVQPVELPHGQTFAIPFLERTHYTNGVLEPIGQYDVYVTAQGDVFAKAI